MADSPEAKKLKEIERQQKLAESQRQAGEMRQARAREAGGEAGAVQAVQAAHDMEARRKAAAAGEVVVEKDSSGKPKKNSFGIGDMKRK